MQGDYKILQLEFVKALLICFNSPILACTPCCGNFEKKEAKNFSVSSGFQTFVEVAHSFALQHYLVLHIY
jgi:hypothetical protein